VLEQTIWEALDDPGGPGDLRAWEGGGFREQRWAACSSEARRRAAGLRALGVERGTVVGCVLTNTFDVGASLVGVWFAGGTVASLPVPSRGSQLAAYGALLASLCEQGGCQLLLVEERFRDAIEDVCPAVRVVSYESLASDAELAPDPPGPDQIAFIQFSSGSTGTPRGCALTTRAIESQMKMIAAHLDVDAASDRVVSWLPLSHDMGLFGCFLVSWALGVELTLGSPERFLVSPKTWMQDCVDRRATITAGPGFGLALALRAARRSLPSGHVPLRAWILGSDRIDWDTLTSAIGAFDELGIGESAFMPAYGLAEATLAVTMTPLGAPIKLFEADRGALFRGDLERPESSTSAATLVGCGKPLPGVEVRIAGDSPVGEICVRSPCGATAYVGDPEKTAETFVGGELRTGDLGAMVDGELYVIGRDDDMLSIGGRNVHAGEIEALIGRETGAKSGSCALVDLIDGGQTRLVAMIEPEEGFDELSRLARRIERVVANAAAARIDECVFVPRRTLPKTPSGKIQRFRCRELLTSDETEPIARVHS